MRKWSARRMFLFITITGAAVTFLWTFVKQMNGWSLGIEEKILSPGLGRVGVPQFHYLIDSSVCRDDIFLVIIIHSAPTHFSHRNTIRKMWGGPLPQMPPIRVVFLLALSLREDIQKLLQTEAKRYHDIVQGNFIDAYRNLTYKHVMGLRWVGSKCSNAHFVLKMDDDIFMDIFQLKNLLITKHNLNFNNSISCYFQRHMPVVRDPSSKWFVTKREFPNNTFQEYCSGWAYVTSPSTALALAQKASTMPFFWVDDVHITGTVAKALGVKLLPLNHKFALETDSLVLWTRSSSDLLWEKIFSPTWGDTDLAANAHHKAMKCYINKCNCCFTITTPKSTLHVTTLSIRLGFAELLPLSIRQQRQHPFKKKYMTNKLKVKL